MPDVRAAAPGLLGTSGAGYAPHGAIAPTGAERRTIHTSLDSANRVFTKLRRGRHPAKDPLKTLAGLMKSPTISRAARRLG